MFGRAVISALNHVLSGEGWARERLRGFSGQRLRFAGGPLALDLVVDGEGLFRLSDTTADEPPGVTIELPADAPFRLLSGGRDALFAGARLTGSADFAEVLAFVFRNLRWDIEDDLSGVVGDVAARRLVRTGTALLAWQKSAAANLASNLSEYLSEESHLLIPAREAAHFSAGVQAVSAEVERLEKRLARLS